MIKIKMEVELNQRVSSHLAIIFLMLLAFLVAWKTVTVAAQVEKGASGYLTENINTRMKSTSENTSSKVPDLPKLDK